MCKNSEMRLVVMKNISLQEPMKTPMRCSCRYSRAEMGFEDAYRKNQIRGQESAIFYGVAT